MPVQKFELATEHDAGVAARFLACEEIHRARTMLTAHPTGFARAIHEFQKSMKGLRALARLLRGSMKADFRPCSRALRDAKRVLADFRDDNATFEAVRMLRSEYLDEGEHRVVDRIERRLHRDGDRGVPDDLPERTALALQALARAEGLFEAVELHSYQELSEGLCRSYRRARKRYREASRQPDDATLHELRKRIDDVRFHLLLLGHSAPTLHQAESELASAIDELLGRDHDLATLNTRLAALGLDSEDLRKGSELVACERTRLQVKALGSCEQLLREKSRTHTKRILEHVQALH